MCYPVPYGELSRRARSGRGVLFTVNLPERRQTLLVEQVAGLREAIATIGAAMSKRSAISESDDLGKTQVTLSSRRLVVCYGGLARCFGSGKAGRTALPTKPPFALSAVRMARGEGCDKFRQPILSSGQIAMRLRTKIILAVVGLAIVWPFAQIGLIAAEAQYFAHGRPYCIEVASDGFIHYRPVTSLLELNGGTLRAPYVNSGGSIGFVQFAFHALLAIDTGSEPEWRNWSYWNQHFDRLTPQQAKAARLYSVECLTQVDSVLKLPLLAN